MSFGPNLFKELSSFEEIDEKTYEMRCWSLVYASVAICIAAGVWVFSEELSETNYLLLFTSATVSAFLAAGLFIDARELDRKGKDAYTVSLFN